MSHSDPIGNRARRLGILLGGRAPWLVRWLPVVGVAIGFALGGLVWLVVGDEVILFREAVLALGALVGLVEFDHLTRPFDHRDDALARRERF